MVYVDQILHIYLLKHCQSTDMQNGDAALQSIILAGRGILVKILITLEILRTYTFLKLAGKMTKKRKRKEKKIQRKKLVTPGFET